jgi:peptidoglycan hydrolase CwlO-like protein
MICKILKLGVLGTAATLVVGGLIFGSDLASYIRSSGRSISSAVKDNVPIEFELRRARDLLDDILPEMQANIRAIAEQEVEIASLKAEIADGSKALAEQKGKVAKVRDCLATPGDSFSVGHVIYTRDELKEDLARRFERTKEAEMVLSGKQRLLSNREKSLQAALGMFERTRSQRAQLESQIAALESQHKMVQMASVGSSVQVDHSKLAQTEKLISEIKKQLDVAERVLAHKAKFVDSIPVETTVNEKDLLSEVDAYLTGRPSPAREATAGNNGQCPAEQKAAEVSRVDRF